MFDTTASRYLPANFSSVGSTSGYNCISGNSSKYRSISGPSTRDTEILERFFERKLADLPIAAIELAVVDDVAAFPELIERQRIDVWRASLFENDPKCFRICGRRVYQGAVHIERQQLIHA